MKKTLALDPGTTTTGYAVFYGKSLLKSGTITTPSKLRGKENAWHRVVHIRAGIIEAAKELKAGDIIVVEEPRKITGHSSLTAAYLWRMVGWCEGLARGLKLESRTVTIPAWRKTSGIKSRDRAGAKIEAMKMVKVLYNKDLPEDAAEAVLIGRHATEVPE